MKTRALSPLLILALLLSVVGCGASQSYKLAVKGTYPVVASRIDGLLPATPAAANLRTAARDPVTYPVASKAWSDAAPVYRTLVTGAALTDHRKADWLKTAELLDQLQAAEARHRNPFLFAPAPNPLPTTAPSR